MSDAENVDDLTSDHKKNPIHIEPFAVESLTYFARKPVFLGSKRTSFR